MKRTIGITSTDDFFVELERDWQAIDRGDTVHGPVHRVYFESAEALSRVLTGQRHNLLKVLHRNGPLNIRTLAALLERNYKNVYQDVKILEEAGLIERDSKKQITAPYEKITIELPLAA